MLDEALLQVLAAIGMGRQVGFAPDGQPPLEPVDIGLGPYFFHLLYCILGHEIKDVHEPASVHRQGVQVRRPRPQTRCPSEKTSPPHSSHRSTGIPQVGKGV